MTKLMFRKNRLAVTALALGLLALGGFAAASTSQSDGNPAAICMNACP